MLERSNIMTVAKPQMDARNLDGNIFAVVGRVSDTLKRNKMRKEADELTTKVWECKSYDEALSLCASYVDFNFSDPENEDEDEDEDE
jgi:hypothetical protein